MKNIFKRLNYLNYPNPKENVATDWLKGKLHVLQFLYDDNNDITNNTPFNYYYYYGSNT